MNYSKRLEMAEPVGRHAQPREIVNPPTRLRRGDAQAGRNQAYLVNEMARQTEALEGITATLREWFHHTLNNPRG